MMLASHFLTKQCEMDDKFITATSLCDSYDMSKHDFDLGSSRKDERKSASQSVD